MRVALFIDGKNFYSGWRDLGRGARVDFERMADWLVDQAGGSVLWGAYYYTGVEGGEQAHSEPQRQLARFLEEREHDRGFFVKRFNTSQAKPPDSRMLPPRPRKRRARKSTTRSWRNWTRRRRGSPTWASTTSSRVGDPTA